MTYPTYQTAPQQYAPQGYAAPQAPPWAGAPAPAQVVAATVQHDEIEMGGEGGPYAPFLKIGPETLNRPAYTAPNQFVGGQIVALMEVHAHKRGAYDPATKKYKRDPMYYKTGKKAGQPIMDIRVIVQTDQRDPSDPADQGLRTMDLDGQDRHWEPTAPFNCKRRAARLAVQAAGAKGLAKGGLIYLAWTHKVPVQGVEQPAINWVAQYTPPGQHISFATTAAPAPEQVAAQPVAQAVQQAPAQPGWATPQPTQPQQQYAPQQAPAQPVQQAPTQPAWATQ